MKSSIPGWSVGLRGCGGQTAVKWPVAAGDAGPGARRLLQPLEMQLFLSRERFSPGPQPLLKLILLKNMMVVMD